MSYNMTLTLLFKADIGSEKRRSGCFKTNCMRALKKRRKKTKYIAENICMHY